MGNDVEVLFLKVKETIVKFRKLVNENNKLKLELEYLKKEKEKTKKQVAEYLMFKKNIDEVVMKIEKIIRKIDATKSL
ncbi:MAG: hypothetical protein LBQ07_01650 [Endomicrobium sp.]|jgi:hypothetical protein|nr:hypothetical protein [Endomicrobium sp.]